MNNFTKEYIKECDCEEIQGLREEFKLGDWLIFAITEPSLFDLETSEMRSPRNTSSDIWLPTGDQLDEEIVKSKEKFGYEKIFYSSEHNGDIWKIQFMGEVCLSPNPLIAKIKLLKELLK